MELEGRVALVTGSGRGIGRAIALRLARAGADILVNDFDPDSAAETAALIEQSGRRAAALAADVTDRGQVRDMVARGLEKLGSLDILINNAGVAGSSCLVRDIPPQSWDRTLAVNLTGVFNCCQAVIPLMTERRWGKIVNIASLAARRLSKLGGADYTAAKAGVLGFSHHLAFELAAFGINVNVICPGATLTDMVKEKTSEEFRRQVGEQVPLGHWIRPEDQAEAVLFLVSEGSRMITGHVLDVDGGQLLGVASDYQEDLRRRTETSARSLKAFQERAKEKV